MIPKSHVIVIEEPNVNLFTTTNLVIGFHDGRVRDISGLKFPESLLEFKHDYVRWSIHKENWYAIGKALLERLKTGEHNPQMVYDQSLAWAASAHRFMDQLDAKNLTNLSNAEILNIIDTLWDHMSEMCTLGVIPVATDMEHFILSSELHRIAEQKISQYGMDIPVAECVNILITPQEEALAAKEKQIILDLAAAVGQPDKAASVIENSPELKKKLDNLIQQFGWLQYGYQGPSRGKAQFIELIARPLIKKTLHDEQKELKNRVSNLEKKQRELREKLHLNNWERKVFSTAAQYTYLKGLRIDVRSRTNFWYDLIFAELIKRFAGLTLTDLRYSTIDELRYLLIVGKPQTSQADLKARHEHCVYYLDESSRGILYGQEAQKLFDSTVIQDGPHVVMDEIKGQVASPGQARGTVKIVFSVADLDKVLHRDILVANATNPDYLPAMYRASAFITDHGGITSHAAIVAREMRKPCVIGTKHATKMLRDGDVVEVDAKNGVIKLVERKS